MAENKAETTKLADPLGVRGDFPVTAGATFLNTPFISPVPRAVEEASMAFARARARAPIPLADMLQKANEVRAKFAGLFGADASEIGFLSATSEAENIVAAALDLKPGENVVVDDLHYSTSYVLYRMLEETKGIELRIVPSVDGRAGPAEFGPYLDPNTRLVSISWVSHQNGYRHPLRELSALAHAHGAYLYADAIQALGMFETSLRDEGVDFLASGTYKWLFGGFGIAPFFVRQEHLDWIRPDRFGAFSAAEELPDHRFRLHANARKFEYATLAFGPLYELDASLDYLGRIGLARIEDHTVSLAAELREELVDLGFTVLTPAGNRSSIVAFAHAGDPAAARALFDRRGVAVSFREGGRQIRAGVAVFNNREDVHRLLAVAEELRGLR
jgi:selenocysteine lyase/cysteine desulfurase